MTGPKCRFATTQSAQLNDIRSLRPEIARWSFSSQQATLRRHDKAFRAFSPPARPKRETRLPPLQGRATLTTAGNSPLTATGAGGNPNPAVYTSKVSAT